MPQLRVAALDTLVGNAHLTGGAGLAQGITIRADVADKAQAGASLSASIRTVQWLGLSAETPSVTAILDALVLAALKLTLSQSALDPAALSASPSVDQGAALVAAMTPKLTGSLQQIAANIAPTLARAVSDAGDVEAAIRGGMAASALTTADASLSIGHLSFPAGVSVTQHTTEGDTTTTMDSLSIDGIELAVEQRDRLSMLKAEQAELTGSRDALDQDRLADLASLIPELQVLANEQLALQPAVQAGTLTPDQAARWSELQAELSTGVVTLSVGRVTADTVVRGSNAVGDVQLDGLSAQASTKSAGYRRPVDNAPTDLTTLDTMLDRSAGRVSAPAPADPNAPLWGDIGDVRASAHIDRATVNGIDTAAGDIGRGDARGVDLRATGDILAIEADRVSGSGLDAMGITAARAEGEHADLRIRGNDIGGTVQSVSGDDIHADMGTLQAGVDSGGASTLRFDADASEQRLRSATLESAHGDGLAYADGSQELSAAHASADDIAIHGASAAGVDDLTVAGADLTAGRYHRAAAAESVGPNGEAIAPVSEMEGGFANVHLDDIRAQGVTADGHGTLDVGEVSANDVFGGMTGTGGGAVDNVTLRGFNARRDETGTQAGVDSGVLAGIYGAYGESMTDPTATGGADRVTFGRASMGLDADNEFIGGEVNDLQGAGISVELLKLPMNERSDPKIPGVDWGAFDAEALGGASGTARVRIPLKRGGAFLLTLPVFNGLVDLKDVTLQTESAGMLLDSAAALGKSFLRVREGVGLIVHASGIRFMVALPETQYDGLRSNRNGASRKGGVVLEAFIEGLMNGVTEERPEELNARGKLPRRERRARRRRDRIADRAGETGESSDVDTIQESDDIIQESDATVQDMIDGQTAFMEEVWSPFAVDTSGIAFDGSGLTLGAGDFGFRDAKLGVSAGNAFTIRGSLGSELQMGSTQLAADAFDATDVAGLPLSLQDMGVAGVLVTLARPLSTERSVELTVEGGRVAKIAWGISQSGVE